MPKQKKIIRLSVSESASLFGVHEKTIRRAIANNELQYVVVLGRYAISFESLLKWSQKKPTTKNKLANSGLGQFVDKWKISNTLYSPNPEAVDKKRIIK